MTRPGPAPRSPASGQPEPGRIGVDAFDPGYGAGLEIGEGPDLAQECAFVEDGGAFRAHPASSAERPPRLAFVDGTMRTEARLTLTDEDGKVHVGLAGSWAAGAVLVTENAPAAIARVVVGRATIVTGGQAVRLPRRPGGWAWDAYAVAGSDLRAARKFLQRRMRDAEAGIAEALCRDGWLTMLDGPLHGIRHRRGLPIVGYVKSHHRRLLAAKCWKRVPTLAVGERSGLFAKGDELACYLRVGDPGPWASGWAGIARIELPAGIGFAAAADAADRALAALPGFASALHRNPRAPVNLTPVAGLERHLHHRQGDLRLATRAVREAVLQKNREEPT